MGAAICCRRPDEIIIDDFKYSLTDNNQFITMDQNSYPEDTEQIGEKNKNHEISNQKSYEQEEKNTKIEGVYDVSINASNQQNNEEEDNTNTLKIINSKQNEQEEEGYEKKENINVFTFKGNQEKLNNSEDLVNIMENEVTLKSIKKDNQKLDSNSIQISNSKHQSQQQNLNLEGNLQQNIPKRMSIDLNIFEPNHAFKLKNNKVEEKKRTSVVSIHRKNQLTFGDDDQIDFNEQQKENQINQNAQQNEELNLNKNNSNSDKFVPKITAKFGDSNIINENENENIDDNLKSTNVKTELNSKQFTLDNKTRSQGGIDLNNIENSNIILEENNLKHNKDDLPEVFGSSNINNYNQENVDLNNIKIDMNNLDANMNDLPEVFGSSDINNYKQETKKTNEENGDGPKDNNLRKNTNTKKENNNLDNIHIDMKNYNLEMKDLPEVFGSFNINNYNQNKIITTTKENQNINMNRLPPSFFIKEETNGNLGDNLDNFENKGISIGYFNPSYNTNILKKGNLVTTKLSDHQNEDYKYFQQESHTTLEPTNLNQYFQNSVGVSPLDLNSFGVNTNSISSNAGLDLQSLTQNGNSNNVTSLGGVDLNNIGYNNNEKITKYNLINIGVPNSSISSNYESNSISYSNYTNPSQSYNYNYS